MSVTAPGWTKALTPRLSPAPSSLFSDEPLFFPALDKELQLSPSIEREEAEVVEMEGMSERP